MKSHIFGQVSVVIPVFNRPQMVVRAVGSVLEQTYSNFEIILVDDGSTDETHEILADLARRHPDRIRVVRQKNAGPGPARETGRRLARGEFIQYLDSDDLLHPQKFERQIAALNENPSADIVYGITRLIDSEGVVLDDCLKWSGQDREFLFPGLLVDRWWSTHTPLWRKAFCDRIGPWSSLRYSEDWEYEARAGALQARLIRVPEVVCDVRKHGDARETTSGHWLSFSDQVHFFQNLYDCAVQANVLPDCSEMKHFVRWVFASARSAGRAGELDSAKQLMALAEKANAGHCRDLVAYKWAVKWVGWHVSDRLINGLHWMLRRKSGRHTQPQSWMGGANESFS